MARAADPHIAKRLAHAYLQEEAYGDVMSALIELESRYATAPGGLRDAGDREVATRATLLAARDFGVRIPTAYEHEVRSEQAAEVFLAVLPDPEFLTALEHGRHLARHQVTSPTADGGTSIGVGTLLSYAQKVFERRGLPYRASLAEGVTYTGEPTVRDVAVEPALACLQDRRFAGARDEFLDAFRQRRIGGNGAFKQSVIQASNAVESVLKALMVAHGQQEVHQPAPLLFKSVSDPQSAVGVPPFAKKLVLAASDLRNMQGAHGQGARIREVPQDMADAAIGSAAVAISFLARYMPK
jgi:hypothetical protein